VEIQEKQIGAWLYRTTPLTAVPGIKLTARLMNILGPALAKIETDKDAETTSKSVAAAVMSDPKLEEHILFFVDLLGPVTMAIAHDGTREVSLHLRRADFDKHFAARQAEMLEWLWWAIEVNSKDFLGELFAKANEARATKTAALKSPSPAAKPG
jgi:hypothetical protein